MSGASGKVPAAIHLTPEAAVGGTLARVRDGDLITLDADAGTLELHVEASELAVREVVAPPDPAATLGRGLFGAMRARVSDAANGASVFPFPDS